MRCFRLSLIWIVFHSAISVGQPIEQQIAFELFDVASSVGRTGTEAVELAAEAVWGASELNGSATFTGTLTQSAINADIWTYSQSPTDRLIVAYHNGPRVELAFTVFNGYTDGTWEDFVDQHELDFTVFIDGLVQVRVESQSQYVADKTTRAVRRITGTALYGQEVATLDVQHEETSFNEIDSGWLHVTLQDGYSGEATTATRSFTLNQGWWTRLIHTQLGSKPEHVRQTELWNNSSVTHGGIVYRYEDAYAYMIVGSYISDALFNVVLESDKWEARGTFTADGQVMGSIAFAAPVLPMAYMPQVVVRFNGGGDVVVPGLMSATATDTEHESELPATQMSLESFPNPFRSSTTITYETSRPGPVRLSVYDLLGREVATLVDRIQPPGRYEVKFEPDRLPNGLYVVRLRGGDHQVTRPMILAN